MSRIGHAITIDVAAWSRTLLEEMATWDPDEQIEAIASLYRLGDGQQFPYPCWENGLVDLWDDEPVAHAIAAIAHGLVDHVRRQIWSAQAAVVLPFVDRIRRGIIGRYREPLDRYVSPKTPYIRMVNEREIAKTDPAMLELFDLSRVLDDILEDCDRDLLRITKLARDYVAHVKPLAPSLVHRLSEHYETNRDRLENDIPGWRSPCDSQTITMTVGAVGAAELTSAQVVSPLHGGRDPNHPDVPRTMRSKVERLLTSGEDTRVDASYLHRDNGLRQAHLSPPVVGVRSW